MAKENKTVPSESYQQALQAYCAALKQFHDKNYAAAQEAFRAIERENPDEPELGDRARNYALISERRQASSAPSPTTAEEYYRQGVLQLNGGAHDAALDSLNSALTANPSSADYLYARASLYALQGKAEQAAADLRKAITSNPKLRFFAVNDPDFERVRDEAVFIDVIEPTPAGS